MATTIVNKENHIVVSIDGEVRNIFKPFKAYINNDKEIIVKDIYDAQAIIIFQNVTSPIEANISDLLDVILGYNIGNYQLLDALNNIKIDAESVNLNTDQLEDLVQESNDILADQVTQLNNIDTALGSPEDAAATSDTGTFSITALFKRLLQGITSLSNILTNGNQKTQIQSNGDVVSNANPLPVSGSQQVITSETTTAVNATNTVSTILAANANRKGYTVYNDSNTPAYIRHALGATTTVFKFKLDKGSFYEMPSDLNYKGDITAITASGTANLKVTEIT